MLRDRAFLWTLAVLSFASAAFGADASRPHEFAGAPDGADGQDGARQASQDADAAPALLRDESASRSRTVRKASALDQQSHREVKRSARRHAGKTRNGAAPSHVESGVHPSKVNVALAPHEQAAAATGSEERLESEVQKHLPGEPIPSLDPEDERHHQVLIDFRVLAVLGACLLVIVGGSVLTKGKSTAFSVMGFMTCSSLMLVINKVSITCLPYPATVLMLQLLCCAAGVRIAGLLGFIEVEELNYEQVRRFGVTPLAFLATLLANIKILEYANVETFIMVRNATPLATSLLDYLFLGRQLPDVRSVIMLLLALCGSVGYVYSDKGFVMKAYMWAIAWLVIFLFDQVYIKYIISTVRMSNWTRVYYNNVLSGMVAFVYALVRERCHLALIEGWTVSVLLGVQVVFLSCLMGTAMSYFAFASRDALSATSFTVVGNVCKVLSIGVNIAIWDRHATVVGLEWLFVVVCSSALYQQAPLRADVQQLLPASKK
eukprot:TRINITY_DN8589_c1_g3_i1.p1 TRINITY_DN8589_c1_g3~~TRINITY_DN8589_c1_g3_i1.p1  ORF type:complete len:490 (-),score=101.40 TRINITY_DN8589_c1_g3_i1:242-1711(-)